jgi:hypothetical protein
MVTLLLGCHARTRPSSLCAFNGDGDVNGDGDADGDAWMTIGRLMRDDGHDA